MCASCLVMPNNKIVYKPMYKSYPLQCHLSLLFWRGRKGRGEGTDTADRQKLAGRSVIESTTRPKLFTCNLMNDFQCCAPPCTFTGRGLSNCAYFTMNGNTQLRSALPPAMSPKEPAMSPKESRFKCTRLQRPRLVRSILLHKLSIFASSMPPLFHQID
jgi:hypothetical protein